jgi:subtilisin-like proprotein convertase family protein
MQTITVKTKKSTTSILKTLTLSTLNFSNSARIAFSICVLAILTLFAVETTRAQQFCSTTPITIPTSGAVTPYPSAIPVSGVSGTISDITVTLNNIQHGFAPDLDILLVGPQGQKFIIMSDVGGLSGFATPKIITLSDGGTALLPNTNVDIPSGTYKPTNYLTGADVDTFPSVTAPYNSPATFGSATFASVFSNANPNGDWKLYVVDDRANDGGSISGGWCMNFTITPPNPGQVRFTAADYGFDEKDGTKNITVTRAIGSAGTVSVDYATSNGTATGGASCTAGVDYISTSGTLTFPDGVTSQTFPITFCNDTTDEPEETINLQLSNPTGGVTIGTPGAAVITLSRTEQYCGSAPITIPTVGAASVYPSNINVSNLTGTINRVTVTLNNIQHSRPQDVDVLLVGPQGQKFIIMSDVGGIVGTNTYTFADAGATNMPDLNGGQALPGIYKPTNYDTGSDVFSAPAPPAPYNYPAPDGAETFASVFNGSNPNGTWSLYVFDDSNNLGGSISGGWCLSISTVGGTTGQFQFGASNYTFEENQTNAVIGVRRTNGASGAVTVDYATANGTAVGGVSCAPGVDYINTSGTISFADGEIGEKTFNVQMCRDSFKSDETVNLQLSNPTGGAVLGAPSAATLTIQSSFPSEIGFPENYYSASDFQAQTVTIRVRRDNFTDFEVADSAVYTTGGGTATGGASCTAGVDYISATGTVTFAPGTDSQNIQVSVCPDAANEPLEYFVVTLSNPSPGATITSGDMTTKVIIAENQPTVYSVNSALEFDDGICDATRCTLQEAVLAANGAPSADEIRFDPAFFSQPRAINFDNTISISQPATITGPGTTLLTLKPFIVTAFSTSANVSVSGLTISPSSSSGEGFFNTGTLNLTNVVLKQLGTSEEGVIINEGGTVTMTNCSVIDNSGNHGGVNNRSGGTFNIVSSLIAHNTSNLKGGGVRNENGTVNITNSTISGNTADNAGGIYNAVGTININHSTVYGNIQDDIFSDPKVGGILNLAGATVNIKNSIVAGNLANGNQPRDVAGTFVSQGFNLIGTSEGANGFTNGANGDKTGTNAAPLNAMLAALADNGGLTQTHALLAGSPAIDAANPASDLTRDQRGFSRPFDGDGNGSAISDMGAFELGSTSAPAVTEFDFDGDGRADLSVFRSSDQNWYVEHSSNNQVSAAQFGLASDKLAPADYDGDGRTDIAVWRQSTGVFYIFNSSNGMLRTEQFGQSGDILTIGDWDGDGKADLSVYRDGAQSTFFYRGSLNNPSGNITYLPWGIAGDKPMRGDFDGDGKQDAAVFRPSNNVWYIRQSSDSQVRYDYWGISTDKFVPADYDGDGKTDLAVFRNGTWYIKQSSDNQPRYEYFGLSTDALVPADYDGDGKVDIAVFRDGVWYIKQSTNAAVSYRYLGLTDDRAIPNAFINP